MAICFIITSLVNFLFAQELILTPEFKYNFQSDSEEYSLKNLSTQDFEFILNGKLRKNNLGIILRAGYHLLDGTSNNQSDFTRKKGLHWIETPPGFKNDQCNYYIADMKIEYGDSKTYFYLNKWDKKWGPGVNSLTISDKIPTFFHFGFKWEVLGNLDFEYFHGSLKSGINNTSVDSYYKELGSRQLDIARNIVGHRLQWIVSPSIIISASELVVYANRSIDLAYLLPFTPFFSIQTYLGETDNIIMNADIQYLYKNMNLYFSFIMDEWSPLYTFDDRVYRHRLSANNYYSWGYPVGFWGGPHSEEFYFSYSFNLNNNNCQILYTSAKRGVLSDSLLVDQYNRPSLDPIYQRYSQGLEKKNLLSIIM